MKIKESKLPLVSPDVILLGISSTLRLLVINLASVPDRQLINSPTATILERIGKCLPTHFKMKHYPFKVWLTTLLVAPLLQSIFIQFYHEFSSIGSFIPALFSMIMFSFIFSLPSFFLYFLIIYLLRKTQLNGMLIKTIGALSAIGFMLLTYSFLHQIMGGDITHPKTISFLLAYSICIAAFSFVFRLNNQHSL